MECFALVSVTLDKLQFLGPVNYGLGPSLGFWGFRA